MRPISPPQLRPTTMTSWSGRSRTHTGVCIMHLTEPNVHAEQKVVKQRWASSWEGGGAAACQTAKPLVATSEKTLKMLRVHLHKTPPLACQLGLLHHVQCVLVFLHRISLMETPGHRLHGSSTRVRLTTCSDRPVHPVSPAPEPENTIFTLCALL